MLGWLLLKWLIFLQKWLILAKMVDFCQGPHCRTVWFKIIDIHSEIETIEWKTPKLANRADFYKNGWFFQKLLYFFHIPRSLSKIFQFSIIGCAMMDFHSGIVTTWSKKSKFGFFGAYFCENGLLLKKAQALLEMSDPR